VTLDAALAALARARQGQVDPLQALFVPAEPRLRDAVEQREGRVFGARSGRDCPGTDHRGMMPGGRECAASRNR